jgi:hypothetical protein
MAGILFLKTKNLKNLKEFYSNIDSEIWLDQGDCIIFKHDNFLFGFCERDKISKDGLLTFFYKNKQEVDVLYTRLHKWADNKPAKNKKYNIYNFFAKDPDGREIEFQAFLHKIDFDWEKYR